MFNIKRVSEKSNDSIKQMNTQVWTTLLWKIDALNRRVKEPGWNKDDIEEVYRLKDAVIKLILTKNPGCLSVKMYYQPYYLFSTQTKDKAGEIMRKDTTKHPFEYYLSLVEPTQFDREIPEKATVEIIVECMEQKFSFHQRVQWIKEFGIDTDSLPRKIFIPAPVFHHDYLEESKQQIEILFSELDG